MAGDWIKFEKNTSNKAEVFRMADKLNADPDAIVGKLLRVWAWLDDNITQGDSITGTRSLIDRLVNLPGFADAMICVGWLQVEGDELRFSNYERHNGETSKKRALTAKRNGKLRHSRHGSVAEKGESPSCERHESDAASVTGASPRTEQRREEKKEEDTPPPLAVLSADADMTEPEHSDSVTAAQFVLASWNTVGPVKCSRLNDKLRGTVKARLRVPWWSERWLQALEKIPDCPFLNGDGQRGWKADFAWFLKPNSVQEILDGKYDLQRRTLPIASAGNGRFERTISACEDFAANG